MCSKQSGFERTSSLGHAARSLMRRVSNKPSVAPLLSTYMTSKNCSCKRQPAQMPHFIKGGARKSNLLCIINFAHWTWHRPWTVGRGAVCMRVCAWARACTRAYGFMFVSVCMRVRVRACVCMCACVPACVRCVCIQLD